PQARGPGAHLPRVRAGRRLLDPQIRRHRPWAGDFQAHRRAHERPHRGRQRARRRRDLQRHRAVAGGVNDFAAPDLHGRSVMIAVPAEIEAALFARRLGRWGARVCTATDAAIARALLPERHWDALLIDHALAGAMREALDSSDAERRIVLLRPGERGELAALKAQGFTGY